MKAIEKVLEQYKNNELDKGMALLFRHADPTRLYAEMAANMQEQETSLQIGGPDIVATLATGARQGEVIGQNPKDITRTLSDLNVEFSKPQGKNGSTHIAYILGEEKEIIIAQEPLSKGYDAIIQGPERQETAEHIQKHLPLLNKDGVFLHPNNPTSDAAEHLQSMEEVAQGRIYIPEKEKLSPYNLERKISD